MTKKVVKIRPARPRFKSTPVAKSPPGLGAQPSTPKPKGIAAKTRWTRAAKT